MAVGTKAGVITKAEIKEVLDMHFLLGRVTLVKSLIIGEKLSSMKERVPDNSWGQWVRDNLSQLGQQSAGRYIRLFVNKEKIEKKFKIRLNGNLAKLTDYPTSWPTIREAESFIRGEDKNPPRGDSAAGGSKEKGTGNGGTNGKGEGNGQNRKDAKNKTAPFVAYTLETFAKELGEVINRAKDAKIPLLTICDMVGQVHGVLVKECKVIAKPSSVK